MRKLKFYKDEVNDWYVDLPEWEGDIADLQMVAGADTMLDILAQGDDHIWLKLGTEQFRQQEKAKLDLYAICADIHKLEEACPSSGAVYLCTNKYLSSPLPVWLCDVTKFVFGEFPETIWIY